MPTQKLSRPRTLVMFSLDPTSSKLNQEQPPAPDQASPAFGKPLYVPATSPNVPADVQAVAAALSDGGFDTSVVNVEDDVDHILSSIVVQVPDLIFNMVSEFEGDNHQHSLVASFLDLLGETYTSGDALCLARCPDRVDTHLLLHDSGIPVPPFVVVRDLNSMPDTEHLTAPVLVTQAFDDIYPDEGADHPLDTREELLARIEELSHEFELPFLVEEFVGERRIQAIVIGNRVLEVLPLTENKTEPDLDEAQPVTAKHSESQPLETSKHLAHERPVLAQLPQPTVDRIRQLAMRAFRVMVCRDVAQIDFHLDETGAPYVVDVRPHPSYRADDAMAVAAGLDERGFKGVVMEIATVACQRYGLRVPTPRGPPNPTTPTPATSPETERADTQADASDEPSPDSEVGGEQPGEGVAELDEERAPS